MLMSLGPHSQGQFKRKTNMIIMAVIKWSVQDICNSILLLCSCSFHIANLKMGIPKSYTLRNSKCSLHTDHPIWTIAFVSICLKKMHIPVKMLTWEGKWDILPKKQAPGERCLAMLFSMQWPRYYCRKHSWGLPCLNLISLTRKLIWIWIGGSILLVFQFCFFFFYIHPLLAVIK